MQSSSGALPPTDETWASIPAPGLGRPADLSALRSDSVFGDGALRRTSPARHLLRLLLVWTWALVPVLAASEGWGLGAASGALRGRTLDERGQAVSGASLLLLHPKTGARYRCLSDSDGGFRFVSLLPGSYDLEVEREGFAGLSLENLSIQVATTRRLTVRLKPSQRAGVVLLTDQPPLLRGTPALGVSISGEELRSLPVYARRFLDLASLAPGTGTTFHTDPEKAGELTLVSTSSSGRSLRMEIDGGDANDDLAGGASLAVGLEMVAELKVQTQQYDAVHGGASGVVALVTRSGTNRAAGAVLGLVQNEELTSRTRSSPRGGMAGPPATDWHQLGGSVGAPLRRDRFHLFAAYEGTRGEALPLLVPLADLGLAKLSYRSPADDSLRLRYASHNLSYPRTGNEGLEALPHLGLRRDARSLLVAHTRHLGSHAAIESAYQWSEEESRLVLPVGGAAALAIGSGGQSIGDSRQEKSYFRVAMSLSPRRARRRHDLRVGAAHVHEPVLVAALPTASPPSANPSGRAISRLEFPNRQWAGYFQDQVSLGRRLLLRVGLRYEYTDLQRLDQRGNPVWQVLSTETQPIEAYLRDFQGGAGGLLKPDTDDLAPRLALSWDALGDGTRLLQGGIGLYHDFPRVAGVLFWPQASALGLPGEVASPTLETPYSTQWSLGYSWQVTPWLGFNVDGSGQRYRRLPFRFRSNPWVDGGQTRRFPELGEFRLWYGRGWADSEALSLSIHGRLTDRFQFRGFYTLSRSRGIVLAGIDEFRLTDPIHQPDLSGDLADLSADALNPLCGRCTGPLNSDAGHRVTLSGFFLGPFGLHIAGVLRWRGALPYTVHSGEDLNGDGFALDLPDSVPHVNSSRGTSFAQVDLRLSRRIHAGRRARMDLIGEIFNLLDNSNPAAFIGDLASEGFGRPTAFAGDPYQGPPRVVQLGLRIDFGSP